MYLRTLRMYLRMYVALTCGRCSCFTRTMGPAAVLHSTFQAFNLTPLHYDDHKFSFSCCSNALVPVARVCLACGFPEVHPPEPSQPGSGTWGTVVMRRWCCVCAMPALIRWTCMFHVVAQNANHSFISRVHAYKHFHCICYSFFDRF